MNSRLDRALALRDHAFRIVSAFGQAMTIGDKRHAVLEAAPWRIVLSTPSGISPSRFSLSIWRGTKVLSVEWNATAPKDLEVLNFKQSDWETEFLAWARRS
jgi:hypothetical protein